MKISKPLVISLIVLSIAVFSTIAYVIGFRASGSAKSKTSSGVCAYTPVQYDDVIKAMNSAGASSTVDINPEQIEALKGECVISALEDAKDLGIRVVRDLTDCGDECMVTMDYSEQRITITIEDNRIATIRLG